MFHVEQLVFLDAGEKMRMRRLRCVGGFFDADGEAKLGFSFLTVAVGGEACVLHELKIFVHRVQKQTDVAN